MIARNYNLVAELNDAQKKYVSGLKGQAKVVFEELSANTEPRLAVDINKEYGPKFDTRQDTLRVTLYYIIIFKGKGIVVASDPTKKSEQFADADTTGAAIG